MITRIDHFVLTVSSLEATCAFYERVLGFSRADTADRPTSLHFGPHKINVHEVGHTFEPKAKMPTPGAGDFCLVTDRSIAEVKTHSKAAAAPLSSGRSNASAPKVP